MRYLLVLLLLAVPCFAEHTETENAITGTTVFGYEGIATSFEIATNSADIQYKIQYKTGTWQDFEPSSGDDLWTVFAGFSDYRAYPTVRNLYSTADTDSTRLLVTPEASTDVTVRMK